MRAATASLTATTAAVLVLAGCSPGAEPAPEAPTSASTPSPQGGPTTTPEVQPEPPEPEPSAPEGPTLPPELAARMPPEEEIDRMIEEAEAAYVAHHAAYDAAARTGFTDPDLVERLFATVTGDARVALQEEVMALTEARQVVNGYTKVLGTELYSLVVPEEMGAGLGVALDACLHMEGAVEDSDGTEVHSLDGEPLHVAVRLLDHDGTWLLATQLVQEAPCPEGLTRP